MGFFNFGETEASKCPVRSASLGKLMRFTAASGTLLLGSLLATSPATAAECKFAPSDQINIETGIEPLLLIDATCTDPDYNESTFVVDKTEALTFQVPDGGPLIPYTEVTGHFPATKTLETLPPGVRQSPTTHQQTYVFRFPAKEFWQNRSMQQQHPTGGGAVDNQMAFTNGAFSIIWMSASAPNHVATHRVHAAATKVAKAHANKLYDNTDKIYSYFWGCSGGGIVAMAAAENVTGIWDGVQPQCLGPTGVATYHSFHWQAHYTAAIPEEKRQAIAEAAAPGGTGDIHAGLNDEEKAVLTEFISAGYPLQIIGSHFTSLDLPLVDPVDIRVQDPTYEDDFWSKPGYAGTNPPNYLKAAYVDGWATITDITRDASGAPTAIQFDPATVPALGSIGDAYLEYWVYTDDGETRLIDPARAMGHFTENKRRFSLQGKFDHADATLTLTGTIPQRWGPALPYTNSQVLLDGLKVGGKVRINNRFILAMYYYPRHSIIEGSRSHDQYRNADGSPKYPQREELSVLTHANYRTMGGRIETGDIKTKTMIMEGMADNLSWPLFNASYAEMIQSRLGTEKAGEMMRFYLHDNGSHTTGGGEPGIFQQSIQDFMAWAEQGIAPPLSTQYTIDNGQVIAAPQAADRHGLQPVMHLAADGGARAVVGINEPVNLAARLEMPPDTGSIVQYSWTIDDTAETPVNLAEPQPEVSVNRTVTFNKPGTYTVRLTVHGQRDGQLDPPNRTLVRNYKDIRVVVQ
ncbi:MAG: PKD domain-containing protein [Bacteroidales bacterium]|nr:PKD domain-containing protein [Bacteroidales bacterium]